MIEEAQVRIITKKVLDEEHLLGHIKIFEKEHNLFRGSHDKIQLPAALNVPQQIVNTISKKIKLEDLEDVSIPTKAVGDFIQYNETTEKWTRQAALAEGSIVIAIADGYFSEDNTNFTWDNTSKIFKVIGSTFLDGAVVINDSNADKDFRVEGSGATYTHLLFTDASANMVGVNEDAPKALFHIRLGTCAAYAGIPADTALLLEGTGNVRLTFQAGTTGSAYIDFCDDDYNPPAGQINYDFANEQMEFGVGTNILLTLGADGAHSRITSAHKGIKIDSATYAVFIADAHNADAYFELQEDNALKWTMGFDYTDSLKFQISEGAPGTNVRFEIEPGAAGLINCYQDLALRNSQEIRFYHNGNYVGFKAVGLSADQIWILPAADGPANEVLGTDGAGNLIWRTHDELAGFVASEHLAALDEDDLVSNSDTNVATQQSIKAYVDGAGYVGTHAMLDGSVHSDSIADAVTRGSIIYGNATPKWDELVIGAANTFLGSDGTDLSYRTAAQVLVSLSGAAGAAFAWNGQNLTGIGTIGCGNITVGDGDIIGASNAYITYNTTGSYLETVGKLGVGMTPVVQFEVVGAMRATSQNKTMSLSAYGTDDLMFMGANYTNDAGSETVGEAGRSSWRWKFANGANPGVYLDYRAASAAVGAFTNYVFISNAGAVFINETTNVHNTKGITIKQGTLTNEILTFKNSDVAHGMTDYAETDTYGFFKIADGEDGGIKIWGFTESNYAFFLTGLVTTESTAKDAGALAPILFDCHKKDGTGVGNFGADANILAVKQRGLTRFIVDVEGDIFYDGAASSYQDHDDIALIAELEDVLSEKISRQEMKRKDIYKKHKVVHVSEGIAEEEGPFFSRFVSTKRKNMLIYGAIRQLNEKIEALEAQLND